MNYDLNEKNIIVTGCNGQIGDKLCQVLNTHNANIFGIDITKPKTKQNNGSIYYQCDLTNENQVNFIVNEIYKKVDNIDCLVHLAGIDYKVTSTLEKSEIDLDHNSISNPCNVIKSVNSNLGILYNILYGLLSRFLKQETSRIILIGSVYGSHSPNPNLYRSSDGKYFYQKPIEYSLSKAMFPTVAKYFCAHYADKGLIINNLEPHAIIDKPDDNFLANFKNISPMKRICKVEEIVDFIICMISTKCQYLNGETIRIDGGWTTY